MTTSTDSPASPAPPRGRPRRRAAVALAGSLLAGSVVAGLAGIGPAQAREPDGADRIRLCDATACYVAWGVVDSDGDGVSDADELAAGTDPHDAQRTPALRDVTELLVERRLPSFEAGFATMVALPADLVELQHKAVGDGRLGDLSFDGFALPTRGDAMSRLGISSDLIKEMGIDLERTGFTLGLEPATKDGTRPAVRVGGIDIRLISDEDKPDGGTTPAPTTPPSSQPPATTPGATTPPTSTGATTPPSSTKTDDGTPTDPDAHGPVVETGRTPDTHTPYTWYADGTFSFHDKWGGFETKDGSVVKTWGLYHDPNYENPDADSSSVVDPARMEAWARMLGSTTRTVEHWSAPNDDGEPTDRPGVLYAYIDVELGLGSFVMADAPRVTTAQPEADPNLADPFVPAPGGDGTGGGGCTTGLCGG